MSTTDPTGSSTRVPPGDNGLVSVMTSEASWSEGRHYGERLLAEEEILALEQEALNRERASLLTTELPYVLDLLPRLLHECQQLLLRRDEDSHVDATTVRLHGEGYPDVGHVEWNESALKGFAVMEGYKLVKSEVTVKLPRWNRGSSFHSALTSMTPWILAQVQNAYNFVQRAFLLLNEENQHGDPGQLPVEHYFQVIEEVAGVIQHAREELVQPSQAIFPKAVYTSAIFQPFLPQDLVIEFSISRATLIVSAYGLTLQPGKSPPKNKDEETPPPGTGTALMGKSIWYRDHWVDVVDHAEVACPVLNLQTSVKLLNSAYELCVRLRDKLAAHV